MPSLLNSLAANIIGFYIFAVLFHQGYKLAVRNTKNYAAATVLLQFLGSASAAFLIPLWPLKFSSDPIIYVLVIVASIFYAATDRLNTVVRKHLEVSIYSILSQISTVFIIIIGLSVFKEPLVPTRVLGAVIILLGNVVVHYNKGKFQLNRYVQLAVLASILFAIAISLDIGIVDGFNLPFYVSLTLFLPGVILGVVEKVSIADLQKEITSKAQGWYVLTGIGWALWMYFGLRSFQLGDVTTVVPLQSVAVLLNVIAAYIFLNERNAETKKLIAAILVMIGIALTVMV